MASCLQMFAERLLLTITHTDTHPLKFFWRISLAGNDIFSTDLRLSWTVDMASDKKHALWMEISLKSLQMPPPF